jgi:N-methylhydantoinase A
VDLFVHGTTVCLNAILQGKTETTGFITTRGFRDILELQRSNRTKIYDPMYRKPTPLVPRHLRFEVDERILSDGRIERPLEEATVYTAIDCLKALGVRTIGVCLLNSYANDAHEVAVVDLIHRHYPEAFVTRSTELSREYREYERSATAAVNAGLMPIMRSYLVSLAGRVRERGLDADVHIMQSNGGMMTSDVARDRPVYTINSGLVGGVVATHTLARLLGEPNAIGSDMGGTSFDVSLIVGGAYRTLPQMRIETPTSGDDAYPLQMASLDTHAIGAGGGSIAWVDGGGLLHVGPRSAGADPGPASYGRGGEEPTITDANLVLGRLNPALFLGGRMTVFPELARRSIAPLARRFDQSVEAMAEGILAIAVNNMANAIRTMTIRRGIDPREFVLISAGGAGSLHSSLIAQELGIPKVVVPTMPGNFAAWGMLCTDLKHDYVRTLVAPVDTVDLEQVGTIYEELESHARETLRREHVPDERMALVRTADVRYLGQGHSLSVPLPSGAFGDSVRSDIAGQFDALHLAMYLHNAPDEAKEIVSLRLVAVGEVASPDLPELASGNEAPTASSQHTPRAVWFGGRCAPWPVYDRAEFRAANRIPGPAVIEEAVSTTLVLPNQDAVVDAYGNLILTWKGDCP